MIVLEALDCLAVALADHGHVWTDRQRALYERAVRQITASDDCTEIDSSASRGRPYQKRACKPRLPSALS